MSLKKLTKEKEEKLPPIFITLTQLYAKKQEWLEKELAKGPVYLTGKNGRPIKLSFAELA